MINLERALELEAQRFRQEPGALLRLQRRRDRKRRNRRIGAGVIAILIAVLAIGSSLRILRADLHIQPAAPVPLSWQRVAIHDAFEFPEMRSVAAWDGGFVAVGDHVISPCRVCIPSGLVWLSRDGSHWREAANDGSPGNLNYARLGTVLNDVTVVGRDLLAVGDDAGSAVAWLSRDGHSWTETTVQRAVELVHSQEYSIDAVAANGSRIVAVGSGNFCTHGAGAPSCAQEGMAWTSTDGVTWQRLPVRAGQFLDVTAVGAGFIVVGKSIWSSLNGVSWEVQPRDMDVFPVGSVLRAVTTSGSGLVAVGSVGSSAAAWTSPDGRSWTRSVEDSAVFDGAGAMTAVAATRSGLVAVGGTGSTTGEAWGSAEGSTWTSETSPALGSAFLKSGRTVSVSMRAAAPDGSGAIAVGSDGWTASSGRDQRAVVWVASPTERTTTPAQTTSPPRADPPTGTRVWSPSSYALVVGGFGAILAAGFLLWRRRRRDRLMPWKADTMKTLTLGFVILVAAFGFTAPSARAATCPVAHAPTLYSTNLVEGHGIGCTGVRSTDIVSVLSRNHDGDVSVLKKCSVGAGGPIDTRLRCRSGVVCLHRLVYRSTIAFVSPSAKRRDRSSWKRLC